MENQYKYTVCIRCITYNHEKYLADALEGFVMQKTTFPFVAIVHDDASTDGTADILRQYAEKYPDIIKPIYETENQYSKHDGSIGRIMDAEMAKYNPKYIAMCEGDDYWTDPYKLQKQVDFMESHPDYSMCFHGAVVRNETSSEVLITSEGIENKDYGPNDIFPGWVIPTASVVHRASVITSYIPLRHQEWMLFGDITLFLKCMRVGKVRGLEDYMSVYRMTEGGAVRTLNRQDSFTSINRLCDHYKFLMCNFPEVDRKWPKEYIGTFRYAQFKDAKNPLLKLRYLFSVLYYYPMLVVRKLRRFASRS